MNKFPLIRFISVLIVSITAAAILMVSIQAFISPQSVMNFVDVQLNNADATSSIRGVYGGIGLLIFGQLIYFVFKNITHALLLVALFGGLYAISRTITLFTDGPLGSFGTQWLITETLLCFIALVLLFIRKRTGLLK
ncbi:MAG TPA: DUF4345 domain-containing protein [Lacibacter sp.]|nr:DUF4345 domain-containing protein [Lacibacter sp.]